jgi:hypothetical protein
MCQPVADTSSILSGTVLPILLFPSLIAIFSRRDLTRTFANVERGLRSLGLAVQFVLLPARVHVTKDFVFSVLYTLSFDYFSPERIISKL